MTEVRTAHTVELDAAAWEERRARRRRGGGRAGILRTKDGDGGIYVLPVAAALELSAPLACDWRDGDVW